MIMKLSNKEVLCFSFALCFSVLQSTDLARGSYYKPVFPLSTQQILGLTAFICFGGFVGYRIQQIRNDRNSLYGKLNWSRFSTIEKIRYGIFGAPFAGYRKYHLT